MNNLVAGGVCLAAVAMASVGFSETCSWTGGASDAKWSSAANWTNAVGEAVTPQNGDLLVIPAVDAPLVVSNDLPGISLGGIWLQGTRPVTIAGAGYSLTGNRAWWPKNENCALFSPFNSMVSNLTEITVTGNATLFTSNAVYGANIVASDAVTDLRLESHGSYKHNCTATLLGDLIATNAVLNVRSGGTHHFYGRVRVKKIFDDQVSGREPANNSWNIYLYNSDNEWESIVIGHWTTMYAMVAGAWPTNTVLRWYYDPTYGWEKESEKYKFTGDQVIDRIDQPVPPVKNGKFYERNIVKAWSQYDLTLRGTADAVCYAFCQGQFDLIWDPVGDYFQEFRDVVHTVTGTITVRGGTFVSGGTNVFKNVSSITVCAGAALDIASTNDVLRAFPSVTKVTLEPGAKLYMTNGAVNAFADNAVDLSVGYGAKIVLGADAVRPAFAKAFVNGVGLAAGTYEDVSWLEGGSVVVSGAETGRTYWKAPVSGNWSDATKWTQGVPTAGNAAFVTAQGTGAYTVTNDVTGAQFCAWTIGTEGRGTATVAFAGAVTNTSKGVAVLEGGILEVPTNAEYVVKGHVQGLKVGAGGEWRVSGGFLALTNSASRYFTFAGESAKTATVSVTSGKLLVSCDTSSYPLKIGKYGLLKTAGDGRLVTDSEGGWGWEYVALAGGCLDLGGAGGFELKTGVRVAGLTFGSGKTTFADDTALRPESSSSLNFSVSDTTGDGAEVTFRDRAQFPYVNDGTFYVGRGTGRAVLNFASQTNHGSSATVTAASSMRIGNRWNVGCDGGYGEVNVSAGYLATTGGRAVQFGGTTSTATNKWDKDGKYVVNVKSSVGCTGVCHVAGGCFAIVGARNRGWYDSCSPCGLLFGYGAFTANTSGERVYRGFMDVTGGVVTNLSSDTVLGAGFGYGEWRQKGGVAQLRAAGVKVGVVGGEGLLAVSGGTFFNNGDAYVGGAGTNAFGDAGVDFVAESNWPIHRHDAVGTLVVSGGVFTVGSSSGKLYVGVDGEGTIEMAGAEGTLTTPYLVLSNTLVEAGTEYEAQTRSTLKFTPDATGAVSPITVTKKATVTPGTRLTFDLSACPEDFHGRLRLIDGTVEGTFAESDMTVTGPARLVARARLRQSESGVTLSLARVSFAINFR